MKTFPLDDLTEAELIDLNHRIVERLRDLQHCAPDILKKVPDKINQPLRLVRRAKPTTGNVIPIKPK